MEWEILKSNYSKLLYIDDLTYGIDTTNFSNLSICMNKFMESIDKLTQRYLKSINWSDDDPEDVAIKDYFEKSLNTGPDRFKNILSAYDYFITIVEYYRGDKFTEIVLDSSFIEEFSFKKKKR